ncbi:phosphatase PAP2 family protein [Streptomyces formicae]|uniref:Phosphatase PAP2 family protein n=1 Tax=Streptomyces formicae TaxID=1616117 RepID=A0ABY3WXP7_9ACTN|nr:phosphatase PAP2 family protein [Streptomyces formicae]UNM15320.1 phosphatase PAP2 family protein [Streptomyces formicae]
MDGMPKRLRWWTELPLVVVVYAAYSAGRLLARGDEADAVGHGLGVLDLEKRLRIDFEQPLNRLFSGTPALGVPADFVYASLHYLVTPAILVWLFRRRPAGYRTARTWLMVSTLLGLVGFTLMPTCPPRLLAAGHGFTDTMAQFSSYGWWGGEASAPRGLGGMTNQFAAMPSLHVGWALWCGVMLWLHGRGPVAKVLAVAYPTVIALVVMGTANHYFLDAVAGGAVMGAGLLLTRPALRLADRVRARSGRRAARFGERVRARSGERVRARSGLRAGGRLGITAPIVGGGCETSAGEHIPGQRTPSAGAGDSTPAATR